MKIRDMNEDAKQFKKLLEAATTSKLNKDDGGYNESLNSIKELVKDYDESQKVELFKLLRKERNYSQDVYNDFMTQNKVTQFILENSFKIKDNIAKELGVADRNDPEVTKQFDVLQKLSQFYRAELVCLPTSLNVVEANGNLEKFNFEALTNAKNVVFPDVVNQVLGEDYSKALQGKSTIGNWLRSTDSFLGMTMEENSSKLDNLNVDKFILLKTDEGGKPTLLKVDSYVMDGEKATVVCGDKEFTFTGRDGHSLALKGREEALKFCIPRDMNEDVAKEIQATLGSFYDAEKANYDKEKAISNKQKVSDFDVDLVSYFDGEVKEDKDTYTSKEGKVSDEGRTDRENETEPDDERIPIVIAPPNTDKVTDEEYTTPIVIVPPAKVNESRAIGNDEQEDIFHDSMEIEISDDESSEVSTLSNPEELKEEVSSGNKTPTMGNRALPTENFADALGPIDNKSNPSKDISVDSSTSPFSEVENVLSGKATVTVEEYNSSRTPVKKEYSLNNASLPEGAIVLLGEAAKLFKESLAKFPEADPYELAVGLTAAQNQKAVMETRGIDVSKDVFAPSGNEFQNILSYVKSCEIKDMFENKAQDVKTKGNNDRKAQLFEAGKTVFEELSSKKPTEVTLEDLKAECNTMKTVKREWQQNNKNRESVPKEVSARGGLSRDGSSRSGDSKGGLGPNRAEF